MNIFRSEKINSTVNAGKGLTTIEAIKMYESVRWRIKLIEGYSKQQIDIITWQMLSESKRQITPSDPLAMEMQRNYFRISVFRFTKFVSFSYAGAFRVSSKIIDTTAHTHTYLRL